MKIVNKGIVVIIASVMIVGCASDSRKATIGALTGAVAGAVLGHQADGKKGRFIGGMLGGITGATVGDRMDQKQQRIEEAMRQADIDATIQRQADDLMKITVPSGLTFDSGKASLKQEFVPFLGEVASILSEYPRTKILIIGHTDATGPEEFNQSLSERRANSVKMALRRDGIASRRLSAEGRGELDLIEDTQLSSAKNRRIEILLEEK